ncbi:MAG TPA: Na+/H+ antiporter subunit G [Firmicutes bacterium]|nr:MAG: Na+/H+ antiporter subunit G [Candidatus Omnitrophota bacterium]HDD65061.1 Na+/H+ antiporter subunit G [Bacillota bacterium]
MKVIISNIFLLIGLIFNLLGCIGLVRLPDVYNRLQASTKCVTLGTCSILLSSMIYGGVLVGTKSFLCAIFILITAPTAAHALSRASHIAGIKLCKGSVCDKLEERKKNEEA